MPHLSSPMVSLLSCALCLVAGCASARQLTPEGGFTQRLGSGHPLSGRIYASEREAFVRARRLHRAVEEAQVLLLGETHDNRDHHLLEAQLLEAYLSLSPVPAVAFEMLNDTQCDALAEATPLRDADELAARVDWDQSGWPPFEQYRPVFREVLARGASVRCALPARERVMAAMHGVDPAEHTRLHLDQPLPDAQRAAQLDEIRVAHCGHAPESLALAMQRAQNYKDAAMAEALTRSGGRSALVAGRAHLRRERGVPLFLSRRKATGVVSIAFIDVDDQKTEAADYPVNDFDFVIFTPRVTDEEPCERFRRELRRLKKPKAEIHSVRREPQR